VLIHKLSNTPINHEREEDSVWLEETVKILTQDDDKRGLTIINVSGSDAKKNTDWLRGKYPRNVANDAEINAADGKPASLCFYFRKVERQRTDPNQNTIGQTDECSTATSSFLFGFYSILGENPGLEAGGEAKPFSETRASRYCALASSSFPLLEMISSYFAQG
jgi:hypothetical protein